MADNETAQLLMTRFQDSSRYARLFVQEGFIRNEDTFCKTYLGTARKFLVDFQISTNQSATVAHFRMMKKWPKP